MSPPPPIPLKIGYVPEHFSTPLHFAATHFSLSCTLIPYPSGTGHMIASLQNREIDVGIGLTEGWIAGSGSVGKGKEAGYKLVGTYVETPLCWGVSTGGRREDIVVGGVQGLRGGKKMGVSRVGSGSYVMGFVLADREGWLDPGGKGPPPFEVVPLQTFEKLREAVNNGGADFFMWEHFTSKRYYDSGAIRRVGEIYTPWPSWHIVARPEIVRDERLDVMIEKLNLGVRYFKEHQDEAVRYISTELDYSADDAREWLKTVEFARDVKGVSTSVVEETVKVLKKAGVLGEVDVEGMIGIRRLE
ncbi:hypothetical protein N7G274_006633 [Stereocaulon virgatum]|uniref:Ca3427-like PBP 2 domain-containing protein n=1 Tax=Stereocaulon virgatum TaxID=373712 RepID=A0ABR4A7D7_9LECA